MRQLILLRHAIAMPPGHAGDHGRALAPQGIAQTRMTAEWLNAHGIAPDRALVSTARRARETWDIIAARNGIPTPPVPAPWLYEANAGAILSRVRQAGEGAASLILVGHNPGLADLAVLLAASLHGEAGRRLAKGYPPGGVCVFDCPIDGWDELQDHTADLRLFASPLDPGSAA